MANLDFTNEQWKDIVGYEGLYQVSDMGRVRSLETKDNRGRIRHGKIIKPRNNGHGYLGVCLCKNGKPEQYYVHRLVAGAFCDNPNKYKTVNHKDENPQNNHASNLEWCTQKYNNCYGTKLIRNVLNRDYKTTCKKRKTIKLSLDGTFLGEWESASKAAKDAGLSPSRVSNACRNATICGGFRWIYAEDCVA